MATVLLAFVVLVLLLFGSILLFGTVTNYQPGPQVLISSTNKSEPIPYSTEFTVLSWNIGYAALSNDMDFFYDGGKNVRPSKAIIERNFEKILAQIAEYAAIDFILLQEVDRNSHRSWNQNQIKAIEQILPEKHAFFTPNYDVKFVPKPFSNPLGKVFSGQQSLSTYLPKSVIRHAFPGNYPWPTSVFMLDRCFMVQRFDISNGKELLIINTHNSAYDSDGFLRKGQLAYLKEFLLKEYSKGNYIAVGGDWNQCPPDLKITFDQNLLDTVDYSLIDSNYLPADWQWIYDPAVPTNRRVMTEFNPEITPQTLIDFYLFSPNIEIIENKTFDLSFTYSDHQPIYAKFKLK